MTHGPFLKLVLVLVIVVVAIGAGLPALRRKARGGSLKALDWGESFAAGVFLGAGLIHMLGDADADFAAAGFDYPWAMVICGAMLLLLLWLEHLGNKVAEARGSGATLLPLTGAAMLSVHSFLAGAALGTSSTAAVTLVIFVAVLAHKVSAAFALALQLAGSALNTRTAVLTFAVFVAMFPLGALVGQGVTLGTTAHPLLEPAFSALAAGTFLYLATLHDLRDSPLIARCGNPRDFALAVAGFAVMAVVAIWT